MESERSDVTTKVDDGEGSPRHRLDEERQRMAEEFNTQRARMKELFLQKEEELRSLHYDKQQLQSEILGLRAELQQLQTLSQNQSSEIESLQMLVHETVEASSSAVSHEVRKLQTKNLELEQQLNFLSKQQASQDAALAPAALVRSIARKLGADMEPEEAAKKVSRHAQEDAELLRSLVEPLEEEIKALKDKLRSTDTQLQLHQQKKVATGDSKSLNEELSVRCDMCQNYEKQLVTEQSRSEEARSRTRDLERALKMATEELEGARSIHEETVQAWRAERSSTSEQLERLQTSASECRSVLDERGRSTAAAQAQVLQHVTDLTVHREMLQEKLDTLERDNEMLIGKYTKKAMELQNEDINLPDTVEELQEHVLRLREELIVVTMGKEASEEAALALRRQLQHHAATYHEQTTRLATTMAQQQQLRQELETLHTERHQFNELGEKLHQANDKIEDLLNDKGRLQSEVIELRQRISSLQMELDNSEKVQQDFVRLSQSLQIQLERIREAETEVRWQCEEDISECPSCQAHLNSNKHKVHCRHCGRIFCPSCLSQSVQSGPRRTQVKVCTVCYTLLQPHAKPYFSTDPPRNPI